MKHFLLVYRRSSGSLINLRDLGSDHAKAQLERRKLENEFDPDIEIVVLSAETEDDLRRTHSRYFRDVPELAESLRNALPS